MDTVLYFPRNSPDETMMLHKRIEAYAKFGVDLQTGDVRTTVKQAKSFIEFWNPVACIVNNDTLPVGIFRGIPSIFCHRDPKTLPPKSILFAYDENAIAKMAARELLRHDLASYCYVPNTANEYWSRERERGFLQAMEVNFKLKCTSVCPIHRNSLSQVQSSIASHLLTLPKPIGVFAANDVTARTVADACFRAHLAIPDDVVILGVDNNVPICESPRVSLSSINICMNAVNQIPVIKELLSGVRHKTRIIRDVPTGVVRRASTMRFARTDREVQAAVELIRRQACGGLTANEVIGTFNCSRRMAETRFRATTGHSILDEIQGVRMKKAKELLADGKLKADEIAARCGYRSRSSVFRLLAKNS